VVIAAVGLLAVPVHLATYRERGVLRRFRASAISPLTVFAAQGLVGLIMAALGAAVLVGLGAALPVSPGVAIAGFLVGTLSFLALGFLLAGVTGRARAAQAVGMLLFFPMWLLSGAGPPPGVMSDGMRAASDVLPLTQVVRALQDPWLGWGSAQGPLLVLGLILVASLALSARSLRSG
jgi:ABC-2 type transport system permease protein